jgi:hypothetical protein
MNTDLKKMENVDFMNPEDQLKVEESLEQRFARERLEWSEKIAKMSAKMKKVFDIPELMTDLYTERQRAVEYYHYLISLLITMNKKYNASYAERHDYYTNKIQVRYPNESTKHNRILVDLAEQVEKRATIDNHSKFIEKTIGTLDNIIFAIPRRVEIEQISRGK